jgi:hypothetical protein
MAKAWWGTDYIRWRYVARVRDRLLTAGKADDGVFNVLHP